MWLQPVWLRCHPVTEAHVTVTDPGTEQSLAQMWHRCPGSLRVRVTSSCPRGCPCWAPAPAVTPPHTALWGLLGSLVPSWHSSPLAKAQKMLQCRTVPACSAGAIPWAVLPGSCACGCAQPHPSLQPCTGCSLPSCPWTILSIDFLKTSTSAPAQHEGRVQITHQELCIPKHSFGHELQVPFSF